MRCDVDRRIDLFGIRQTTDTQEGGREGHGLSDVGDQFLRGGVATRLDVHSVD